MGDQRRFDRFGEFIQIHFDYARHARVLDVAGGLGYLQLNLRQRGFQSVTTIDNRVKILKGLNYQHRLFDCKNIYPVDLLAAMHPDQATDHVVCYAVAHMLPFVICPCCIKPSAVAFNQNHRYAAWIDHLVALAQRTHDVELNRIRIRGKQDVLVGKPRF